MLCHGAAEPMALVRERLEIGDALGEVPEGAPAVPLQRDLEAQQRRFRLKPTAEARDLDVDLREPSGRGKSLLLHRLRLLGIPWGEPREAWGSTGTFRELWRLRWQPELAVRVIEGSLWGNTVEEAATAFAVDEGRKTTGLPELTELLDRAILAGLPAAVASLLDDLQARAAVSADLRHMMDALPPLARVSRYGDVRGTGAGEVLPVVHGLFERIVVGLPGACSSLDDAAAATMADSLGKVQDSLALLDLPGLREDWREVLCTLMDLDGAHGLIRGFACRLLVDQGTVEPEDLGRRARLALSPAVPPRDAAAWIEGLLRGSGLLLLHHDALWGALDEWVEALHADAFPELLPLLRRAFSKFHPPERKKMGEKVKHLRRAAGARPAAAELEIDRERAGRVLPVLARILGAPSPPAPLPAAHPDPRERGA